jgi:hypothetical protein
MGGVKVGALLSSGISYKSFSFHHHILRKTIRCMFSITSAQTQKVTFFLGLFSTTSPDLPPFFNPPFFAPQNHTLKITGLFSMTCRFQWVKGIIDKLLYYHQHILRKSLVAVFYFSGSNRSHCCTANVRLRVGSSRFSAGSTPSTSRFVPTGYTFQPPPGLHHVRPTSIPTRFSTL